MALTTVVTVLAMTGCRRSAANGPGGVASPRVTISACPAGVATAPKDDAPLANLTVSIATVPQVGRDTEATLRLEGETTRNTVRIDATTPSQFALAKGVYVVRVSLSGYSGAEGRVTLTAGCEATMTMELRRGSKK